MATRKPRDYKAEYARAKARAQAEGYRSERARKKARRAGRERQARSNKTVTYQGFTVNRDVQSNVWAIQHSRQKVTEFSKDWTDAQKNQYYKVFVADYRKTKRDDILDYLIQWYPERADEWTQLYG